MNKLTYILFSVFILFHAGCNSKIPNRENEENEIIDIYHDILNVIVQDQNLFVNNRVIFKTDSLNSDTVDFRDFALVSYPHDWFTLDSSKMNIKMNYNGYFQPLNKDSFPSIKDFNNNKAYSDTILMPNWDTERINGCRTVNYGENSIFLSISKRREGDILLTSYPFLNTNKDTAMVYTSFYTQDNQIDKIINLIKNDTTWRIINKVIFLLEIREQTYNIDESRSKKETVVIIKGRFYE